MACGHYSFTRVLLRDTVRTFVLSTASTAGMMAGFAIAYDVKSKVAKSREEAKTEPGAVEENKNQE